MQYVNQSQWLFHSVQSKLAKQDHHACLEHSICLILTTCGANQLEKINNALSQTTYLQTHL